MKKKIIIGVIAVCAAGFAAYHFSAGKKPSDLASMNNEAVEYVKEGKLDKAIDSYNDALETKQDPTLYYNRGVAYMNKGDNENAVKDFSKAIEMQPSNLSAFNNRALVYRNLGKYDESVADYTSAIKIKADFSVAWYGRAVSYKLKGDKKQAAADFRKAASLGYAEGKRMAEELEKE